jgi:hypothetical protein
MEFLEKYPALKERLESLYESRSNEILTEMLKTDDKYNQLFENRANTSMALKKSFTEAESNKLLEEYSDTIYEQEIYEQNFLYRQAIYDALSVLHNSGIM